jgi:hypothetical protein
MELYHMQFSLQAASPEAFGYTLVYIIRAIRMKLGKFKRNRKVKGSCEPMNTTYLRSVVQSLH